MESPIRLESAIADQRAFLQIGAHPRLSAIGETFAALGGPDGGDVARVGEGRGPDRHEGMKDVEVSKEGARFRAKNK